MSAVCLCMHARTQRARMPIDLRDHHSWCGHLLLVERAWDMLYVCHVCVSLN